MASGTPGPVRVRGRWRRAVWGGVLSLALPGLGQVYARSWTLGLALLCVQFGLGAAAFGLTRAEPSPDAVLLFVLLVSAAALFHLGCAVDAARRIRNGAEAPPFRWFRSTWIAAGAAIALNLGIGAVLPAGWRTFSIPSSSAMPSLLVGDTVVADTRHGAAVPEYGDTIVFKLPRDPRIDYIKRVVGLPGDRIQMIGGQLVINGQTAARQPDGVLEWTDGGKPLTLQRYIETLPGGMRHPILKFADDQPLDNTPLFVVPDGHVFTLGDNRDNSLDSRVLSRVGYVPIGNIVGRAITVVWAQDRSRIGTVVP